MTLYYKLYNNISKYIVVVEQRGSNRQRISLQICTRRIYIYIKIIQYNNVDWFAGETGTGGRVFSPLRFIRYYYY